MPEKYRGKEELVPEEKKLPATGVSQRLAARANLWLTLSLIFLTVSLIAAFGLWGYENNLIEGKADLEKRLKDLESQRDPNLEANFIELKKGIENFKNVFKNHIYPSYLFVMLEELALPQVRFTQFEADLSQAIFKLEVEAVSYNVLAKQIVAFEEDPRVKKVELSEVGLGEAGGVDSSLEIELNLDFLRSAP